jgi:hypothetical protein
MLPKSIVKTTQSRLFLYFHKRNLSKVQRLFSMFPLGLPGVALLVLRVCVAASSFVDGTVHWTIATSPWIFFPIVLTTVCVCLGLLTPVCASLCSFIEFFALVATPKEDMFHLVISMLTGVVLAVLGPGAYSIDARIFGRRLLTVPPRKQPYSD